MKLAIELRYVRPRVGSDQISQRLALGNQCSASAIGDLFVIGKLTAINIEHEEAKGGRQVGVLPSSIDGTDQVRHRLPTLASDLSQRLPERFLKADTRAASRNCDRALGN
jgi:hypothetical protein